MNVSPRKKSQKLSQIQTITLAKWWEANHAGMTERRDTYVQAAGQASAALGIPLNASHVQTMAKSLAMPLADRRKDSPAPASPELLARVEALEQKLAGLASIVSALSQQMLEEEPTV